MALKNNTILRKFSLSIIIGVTLIFLQSCKGFDFNFTGGRLGPEYKQVAIRNFFNDAPEGPANLGINFTEKLKEYYQRNTPLSLVESDPHIELSGSIVGYAVTPVSPSGTQTQQADLQRLTITVKLDYADYLNEGKSFNNNFSFFQDFSSSQTLAEVENDFIEVIFDQIIFDIFNKTYANW